MPNRQPVSLVTYSLISGYEAHTGRSSYDYAALADAQEVTCQIGRASTAKCQATANAGPA